MDDAFKQRGSAIENAFFREKDQQLLDRLRTELKTKEYREALAHAGGITDSAALDALAAIEIRPETLVSVSLVPLVAVAWADGVMDEAERNAILDAAEKAKIEPGSASHDLIGSWLDERPDDSVLDAWKAYINALSQQLDAAAYGQLKSSVMGRATDVAKSAGGFLGMNAISAVEQKTLDDLAAAF